MEKKENKAKKKEERTENPSQGCSDIQCPLHGSLRARGRIFKGTVTRKLPRRIAIEFERVIYIKKYERYMKKKTRIHARLPDCMKDEINLGDYIEVRECRPLSKIINFVVIKKIRNAEEKK